MSNTSRVARDNEPEFAVLPPWTSVAIDVGNDVSLGVDPASASGIVVDVVVEVEVVV